ncbi:hypothetical protein DITRI_Ditri13aG0055200 [Diplodiscus trichospermus]
MAVKVKGIIKPLDVMQGKVAVKVNLLARGILSVTNDRCSLCGSESETTNHLFFSCKVSWIVWSHWSNLWGISWAGSMKAWQFLIQWHYLFPYSCKDELSRITFCAVIWSIWLASNEIIFRGSRLDIGKIIDLSKIRCAEWVKSKWPHLCIAIHDIIRHPNVIVIPPKSSLNRTLTEWIAPPFGALKFNVDGSARGKPGPAGIGGILRDHRGVAKVRFSTYWGGRLQCGGTSSHT